MRFRHFLTENHLIEFSLNEFHRNCRMDRICRILFLVILKIKINKNSIPQILVLQTLWIQNGIHFGKTRMICFSQFCAELEHTSG